MSDSRLIIDGNYSKTQSRLIKSVIKGLESLESYENKPKGVFGSEAKIVCGDVTIKSSELDIEFTVRFDDDMEANDAEIKVYNLTQNTINQFRNRKKITIEAGYKGDTGVIFVGYVTNVKTIRDGADKVTTIKCIDDIKTHTISEITFAAGTKASYILKNLLNRTGTPIEKFKMRYDHTYEKEVKVDGDLMDNIKKYSQVCGVSTFVKNGRIYSRYIKEGDNISFTLSEDTGLIGSPEEFEEEQTVKEDKDITIKGFECDCLLQHRMSAGVIVNLKSIDANGTYRVCSGEHTFNNSEAITHIKMY